MSRSHPLLKFLIFLSLLLGGGIFCAADPEPSEMQARENGLPANLKEYDIQDFFIAYGYVQGLDGLAELRKLETVKEAVVWKLIEYFAISPVDDNRFLMECAATLKAFAAKKIEWQDNKRSKVQRELIILRLKLARFPSRRKRLATPPPMFLPEPPREPGRRSSWRSIAVRKALERALEAWQQRAITEEQHNQLRILRKLADRESINEFDLHRLADSRFLTQQGVPQIDPVIEVRCALTFEALANRKISIGYRSKPANDAQRRRIAKEL